MPSKIQQKIIRLTALATLFFYLSTNAWGAIPTVQIADSLRFESKQPFHIELPQDLARLDEIFDAKNPLEERTLFHIQDAHGHYGAQLQTKKILDYLAQHYGVTQVFVEGAASEVTLDPKRAQVSSDSKKNLKFADELAKKGLLNGTDLYLVESDKNVRADGIEDPDLYRKAYRALQEVFKATSQSEAWSKDFFLRLDQAASRKLPPELREVLVEQQKFETGSRDFTAHLKNLAALSKKHLKVDFQDLYTQLEYPQLARILKIQSMEKTIQLDAAQKEKEKLILFLKDVIASPAKGGAKQSDRSPRRSATGTTPRDDKMAAFIPFLESFKVELNSSSENQTALRSSFEELARTAGPQGFHFHDYPHFSLYAGYRILLSEIEIDKLLTETESLFEKILGAFAKTDEQKEIIALYQDGVLLRKLLRLELNRNEWNKISKIFNKLDLERMMERPQTLGLSSPNDLVGDPVVSYKNMDSRLRGNDLQKILGRGAASLLRAPRPVRHAYRNALNFYRLSLEREKAFARSLEQAMTKRNIKKAVIVTGGFHTDGVNDFFQRNKINYATITPFISGGLKESAQVYRSSMLQQTLSKSGNVLSSFENQNMPHVDLLQPPSVIERMTEEQLSALSD